MVVVELVVELADHQYSSAASSTAVALSSAAIPSTESLRLFFVVFDQPSMHGYGHFLVVGVF